jgi:hypothetical protein
MLPYLTVALPATYGLHQSGSISDVQIVTTFAQPFF